MMPSSSASAVGSGTGDATQGCLLRNHVVLGDASKVNLQWKAWSDKRGEPLRWLLADLLLTYGHGGETHGHEVEAACS